MRQSAKTSICGRGRASSSAGIELMHNEIIVLGNSAGWAGDTISDHDVMVDAIDLPPLGRVLRSVGLPAAGQLDAAAASRVVAVLVKAEAARSRLIRGARHVMNDDSDIHSSRHARALVDGVISRRGRAHRPVCLRRHRASGPGWRRPDRGDRSGLLIGKLRGGLGDGPRIACRNCAYPGLAPPAEIGAPSLRGRRSSADIVARSTDRADQGVRPYHRGQRARRRDPKRELLLPAGAVGMRQDHNPANDRRS